MEKIKAYLIGTDISSNSQEAFSLNNKSFFGERKGDKIFYSFSETLYLLEKKQIDVFQNSKEISKEELLKKLLRKDKRLSEKFSVYQNLRDAGHIPKTGLKFGADFRVYEKGTKIGKGHAKWVAFVDKESHKINWQDFSAKNRIANSTKKNLLIAIVDDEKDVLYYEIKWIKP